jgi:hypothetical protein
VPHAVDQLVHPVEIAQQRGLAAAGGSDERGDLTLGDFERDVLERLFLSVEKIEVA